jgi:hypothetical protein
MNWDMTASDRYYTVPYRIEWCKITYQLQYPDGFIANGVPSDGFTGRADPGIVQLV